MKKKSIYGNHRLSLMMATQPPSRNNWRKNYIIDDDYPQYDEMHIFDNYYMSNDLYIDHDECPTFLGRYEKETDYGYTRRSRGRLILYDLYVIYSVRKTIMVDKFYSEAESGHDYDYQYGDTYTLAELMGPLNVDNPLYIALETARREYYHKLCRSQLKEWLRKVRVRMGTIKENPVQFNEFSSNALESTFTTSWW